MKKLFSLMLALCLTAAIPVFSDPPAFAAASAPIECRSVYAGADNCAVIKEDGSLWVWGSGTNAALGQGTVLTTNIPNLPTVMLDGNVISRDSAGNPLAAFQNEPIKLMDDVASACIGSAGYSYAIKTDGSLWIWGGADEPKPHQIATDVIAAEIDSGTTAIIKSDHSLWMKGKCINGVIPGVPDEEPYFVEDFVKVMDDVDSVHLDLTRSVSWQYFAAVVKTDGSLWAWGAMTPKALKDWPEGTLWYDKIYPEKVMDGVNSIRENLLMTDGTLWDYKGGQLVKILDDVKMQSWSGENLAVKNDGSLWAWGYQNVKAGNGSCGGTYDVPYKIMDDVAAVSASSNFALAVKNDGSLWGWGSNNRGQLLKTCDNLVDITNKYGAPSDKTYHMTHQHSPVKLLDGIALPESPVPGAAPAEPTVTPEPTVKRKIPFTDVSESDYYYDSVVWAYTANPQITDGTTATTFSPYSTCTRGQVMTFLWRAAGCPGAEAGSSPFTDVKETDYFYKAVLWAVEKGITDGTSADTFSPGTLCANSHILTFIYRAMGEPGKTGNELWYGDALSWAEKSGLLDGTYSGSFVVTDQCPRCNAVEYLYRYLAEK
ncbi:MAG: S-layer homology domain-containing protein [Firmicutes bacterium]|nr:S-layer homology domain-containing protein [Bacillota bacterium]